MAGCARHGHVLLLQSTTVTPTPTDVDPNPDSPISSDTESSSGMHSLGRTPQRRQFALPLLRRHVCTYSTDYDPAPTPNEVGVGVSVELGVGVGVGVEAWTCEVDTSCGKSAGLYFRQPLSLIFDVRVRVGAWGCDMDEKTMDAILSQMGLDHVVGQGETAVPASGPRPFRGGESESVRPGSDSDPRVGLTANSGDRVGVGVGLTAGKASSAWVGVGVGMVRVGIVGVRVGDGVGVGVGVVGSQSEKESDSGRLCSVAHPFDTIQVREGDSSIAFPSLGHSICAQSHLMHIT
eukprot:gene24972-biopygen1418